MRVKYMLITIVALFTVGVLADLSYAKIDPKTAVGMWLFDEGNGTTAERPAAMLAHRWRQI